MTTDFGLMAPNCLLFGHSHGIMGALEKICEDGNMPRYKVTVPCTFYVEGNGEYSVRSDISNALSCDANYSMDQHNWCVEGDITVKEVTGRMEIE